MSLIHTYLHTKLKVVNMSNSSYDPCDALSIEAYAKKMIGLTFNAIISSKEKSNIIGEAAESYGYKYRKGGLGNLIEAEYFGYDINNSPEPDFAKAGVELKVTPYEKKKDGTLKAGERLVITMISFNAPVEEDFYKSHLWKKCRLILLVYYFRDPVLKKLNHHLDYHIDYVQLFTPPKEDLPIIEHDYQIIIGKILAGRANEISEGDTMYLGACTKGTTAAKSLVPQYYGSHALAKKRAFCFKISYMTYILNNYIVKGVKTYDDESIVKDASLLRNQSFEDYIQGQINQYAGKTDIELSQMFDRPYNRNKAQWIDLAYRMLGIKSNRAAEFLKANIVVKVLKLTEKGQLKEHSPLPPFQFKELLKEDEWENSILFNYLDETKFLFVVFRAKGDHYILKGCQLWNMPYHDINSDVKKVWENTRKVVSEGIILTPEKQKNGIVFKNNLPKSTENRIAHVRPHTSKRFFKLLDGTVYGNGSYSDSDQLPDGRWMPRQSFWLNKGYLLSILTPSLKH